MLKFGTAAVTEPFSYQDASGKVVGFDIDLAYRVADKLGYQIEVVNMPFGDLIPSVSGRRGRHDRRVHHHHAGAREERALLRALLQGRNRGLVKQ